MDTEDEFVIRWTAEDPDGDGMDDGFEVTKSFDPMQDDGDGDFDHDGFTNQEEYEAGTAPQDTPHRLLSIRVRWGRSQHRSRYCPPRRQSRGISTRSSQLCLCVLGAKSDEERPPSASASAALMAKGEEVMCSRGLISGSEPTVIPR